MNDLSLSARLVLGACISCFVGACASAPKANIPDNANVDEVIQKLHEDIKSDYDKQIDLADRSDLSSAEDKLAKAEREKADKDKQKDIVHTLAEARGYLTKAESQAGTILPKAAGILAARKAALATDIRHIDEKGLKAADDNFRSYNEEIENRTLSADKFSMLQKAYLNLEIKGLEEKNIGQAVGKIDAAIKAGASSYTPHLLKQSEWAIKESRNDIATQTHSPENFQKSVQKANDFAQLLTDVLAATESGKVPESAALKIVKSNRKIGQLKSQVGEATADADAADAQLRSQKGTIALDVALAAAQKEFSPKEAEAYRQGNKLLLRLKGIKFAVAGTALPKSSLGLLKKVETIAAKLNPQAVLVEGHTDSSGSADTNKKLSQGRAEAVAKYFSTNGIPENKITAEGFGSEKPVATNKTAAGRAQNRRVDVIITPTAPSEATDSTDQAM